MIFAQSINDPAWSCSSEDLEPDERCFTTLGSDNHSESDQKLSDNLIADSEPSSCNAASKDRATAGQMVIQLVGMLVEEFACFNCQVLGIPLPPNPDLEGSNAGEEKQSSSGSTRMLCIVDYMTRALLGLGGDGASLLSPSISITESFCLWQAAAAALLRTTTLPRRFPSVFNTVPAPNVGLDGLPLSEGHFMQRWEMMREGLQHLKCFSLYDEETLAAACESVIGSVSNLCQYEPPALIDASVVFQSCRTARRSSTFLSPISRPTNTDCVPGQNEVSSSNLGPTTAGDPVSTMKVAATVAMSESSGSSAGALRFRETASSFSVDGSSSQQRWLTPATATALPPRGWMDFLGGMAGWSTGKQGVESEGRRHSWIIGKQSVSDGKPRLRDGGPGFPLDVFNSQEARTSLESAPTPRKHHSGAHRHSLLGNSTHSMTSSAPHAFVSLLLDRDGQGDTMDGGGPWLKVRRRSKTRLWQKLESEKRPSVCAEQNCEVDAVGPDDESLSEICDLLVTVIRGAGNPNPVAASPRIMRVAVWGLACVAPLLSHGDRSGGGHGAAMEKVAGDVMQALLWASTSGLATDPSVLSSVIVAAVTLGVAVGSASAKHAATLSKLVKTGLESHHSSCRRAAYRAIIVSLENMSSSLLTRPDAGGRRLQEAESEPGLVRSLSGVLPQAVGPHLIGREGSWGEAALAWNMVLQLLLHCPSTREGMAGLVAETAGRLLASEEAPRAVVQKAAQAVMALLLAGAAVEAADTVAAGKCPHSTYVAGLTVQASRVCLGWGPATVSDLVERLCGAGQKEQRWLLWLLPSFLSAAVPSRFTRCCLLLFPFEAPLMLVSNISFLMAPLHSSFPFGRMDAYSLEILFVDTFSVQI